MSTIKINTTIWKRPCQWAKQLGVSLQQMNNLIHDGKFEKWHIPELGLTLVRKL